LNIATRLYKPSGSVDILKKGIANMEATLGNTAGGRTERNNRTGGKIDLAFSAPAMVSIALSTEREK
jgi:hypothetical protein